MAFEAHDISPRIGVEIRSDRAGLLGGVHAAEIRALLERRGVVVLPGLDLDDAELLAFARTIGEIHTSFDGDIFKVTLDEKENPQSRYLRRTVDWHMDRMDTDLPPLGSMLTPRVLPESGGETEFANTYAAFEDLPEEERRFLETLRVVHTVDSHFGEDAPYSEEERGAGYGGQPPTTHPLVWHHRSGRKSLVIGMTVNHVVGMDRAESTALLRRLIAWAAQPRYVYRHHWRMGDLVIWDNTGTMHHVCPYDETSGRRLHRVTLLGEEPIRAV